MTSKIEGIHRVIQYFWDPQLKNDDPMQNPIWCLGSEYRVAKDNNKPPASPPPDSESQEAILPNEPKVPVNVSQDGSASDGHTVDEAGWPLAFLDDVESRMWMTYRSGFPSIPRSTTGVANLTFSARVRNITDQTGFTSDTGWGCMIRSGQCVLANAITSLRLGRDWRRGSQENEEKEIISLFADDSRALLSIHSFVKHGELSCGVHPGEWFGPSATARCIQALSVEHDLGLRVYITGDGGDVYEDSFKKVAMPDGQNFLPTLVLVGIRLGIDRITPVYWEALKSCLMMPHTVGIAGGRPSSSHYFIGAQGQSLFYLDPHNVRPHLPYHANAQDYTAADLETCHTRKLRRIHLREMDPSMLLAFLIRNEDDWVSWRQGVKEVQGKRIVHVADVQPGLGSSGGTREGAVDDVETFDDESEDADDVNDDGDLEVKSVETSREL